MKATIVSFRRGRHTQTTNQFLLEIEGCGSKAACSSFIGKRVIWTSPAGKEIHGTITSPHGNSGTLRARFSRGLPGEAVRSTVKLL